MVYPHINERSIKRERCLNCNKFSTLIIWPSKEIIDILNYLYSSNQSLNQFKYISITFLCSVSEALLENLLSLMIWQGLAPKHKAFNIIDSLFDGYQGRNKLLSLYNKLGYGKFKEHLKIISREKYFDDWRKLVEVRNKIVHGKLYIIDYPKYNINVRFIKRLIVETLEVFSGLNNYLLSKHLDRNIF